MVLGSRNRSTSGDLDDRAKRQRTEGESEAAGVDEVGSRSTEAILDTPARSSPEPVPLASCEKTERLRKGVLEHIDALFERPEFLAELPKYFRIDCSTSASDPPGEPGKLKEWSKKVVNSLFDYRRDTCRVGADGHDETLTTAFKCIGNKKSDGVRLYRKLVDVYRLPTKVPFKSSVQNARNLFLHSLDCFDISRAKASSLFAALLSNDALERSGLFGKNYSHPRERERLLKAMSSDEDQDHLLLALGSDPYALRDETLKLEFPPVKFVANIMQYRNTWTKMVAGQLRAQMQEFLRDGDPLSNGWLVQWQRERWVRNIEYCFWVDELRENKGGPVTVKLQKYGDFTEYTDGGSRPLRADDVVIIRFFTTTQTSGRLIFNYGKWANRTETGRDAEKVTFWARVVSVPERYCIPRWTLHLYKPEDMRTRSLGGLAEVLPAANLYHGRCQITNLRRVVDLPKPLRHTLVDPTDTLSSLVGEPSGGYAFETKCLLQHFKGTLNASQYEMCVRGLNRFLYRYGGEDHYQRSGFLTVQGPPGTGKSTAIVALVNLLVEKPVAQKVLLCAPSNAAVDVLIERLLSGLQTVVHQDGVVMLQKYTPMIVRLSSTEGTPKAMSVSINRLASNLVDPRAMRCAPRDKVRSLEYKEKVGLLKSEKLQVVCATLGSLGQSLVRKSEVGFSAIIVDEAGQCTEPEILAALAAPVVQMTTPWLCVLVGDPMQLPPTVQYLAKEHCKDLERSLLQRLMENRMHSLGDVMCLETQYRMHPAISYFARTQFYRGKLRDSQNVRCREVYCMPYHWDAVGRFGPVTFIDTCKTRVFERTCGDSKFNRLEKDIVAALLLVFQKVYDPEIRTRGCWGVLSPYRAQVRDIQETLDGNSVLAAMKVTCTTVDSMQGGEKECIILSTVRSNAGGRIGFLDDYRRFNVAFTRAKKALIVIGDSETLRTDREWSAFISHTRNRAPRDYRYIELPERARVRTDLCPELLIESDICWWSRRTEDEKKR